MSTKDDYLWMIELQLKKWDAQYEKLTDQTLEMNSYVRAGYEAQLEAIRVNRDAAYTGLQQMRAANESAWRQMCAEMDASWDALKIAFNNVSSRFDI